MTDQQTNNKRIYISDDNCPRPETGISDGMSKISSWSWKQIHKFFLTKYSVGKCSAKTVVVYFSRNICLVDKLCNTIVLCKKQKKVAIMRRRRRRRRRRRKRRTKQNRKSNNNTEISSTNV